MRVEEPALFDLAGHGERLGIGIDNEFDHVSRADGDPAVEREGITAIIAGRAHPMQAAAAEPFVEAGQPAEAVAVTERDELRVHRPEYRRLPAERDVAITAAPDAHPPRGQ